MNKKLSTITAPAVAGVIREKTKQSVIAEIKNCIYNGADMIDLHLSCLEDSCEENLKAIVDSCKLPILASSIITPRICWGAVNAASLMRRRGRSSAAAAC